MSPGFTEDDIERAALGWFQSLGYSCLFGPDIAPGEAAAERKSFEDVILEQRLEDSLRRINPSLPLLAIEQAKRKVLNTPLETANYLENNHRFHKLLTDGVDVQYKAKDGRIVNDKAWLVDWQNLDRNEWLAINQYTVIEHRNNRRPDIVVFVNGLPLAIIELKNPSDHTATIKKAFQQLQTYKREIPSFFTYNSLMIASDGMEARAGSLTADWDRFLPWKTVDGEQLAEKTDPQLETLVKGVFDKRRILDLVLNYTVFEIDGSDIAKKVAGYHQYHAVGKAIENTVKASATKGDRRVGVVWHTQGSGKSLSMVFYAGKIIRHPAMENPTLVVLTDRNDLDDQLFGTFALSHELLRQTPVQATSRPHLRELLAVASGGVVFTTIQKFFPEEEEGKHPVLSDRRNIVVIADEAHRSHYDFKGGMARHLHDALPNASFIAFTGTPIDRADKSTPRVFGDYIDIYDIQQAVEDKATVPIYYEARLAKIELNQEERPHIDAEFEEVTEEEETATKQKLKSRWAKLEAMVGTPKRVGLIAKDIVEHFENRLSGIEGKGIIVCMSRRICVDLYNAIVKIRPEWHSEDDDNGFLKVIMTGSASDPEDWQQHIRNKSRRREVGKLFKKAATPTKLVIVRDMWLTGFDAPCLHTMYVDKPMEGHNLMQAIARVNRVFKDKPGGLIVDYLGIGESLKKALASYTDTSRENTGIPLEEAVAIMLEKFEVVQGMLHGFDYSSWFSDTTDQKMRLVLNAMEHLLKLEDGKKRFINEVTALSKAFALAVPHEDALAIRDELGFFQTVKAQFIKHTPAEGKTQEELDTAVRQIVSKAITSDRVVDIFAAAGLDKPDISILSDEFLADVKDLPQKNVALEVLKKLLNDEIRARAKHNLVQSRNFSEMLERTIQRYQSRTIESAQVIEELIKLAKEMKEAQARGEDLGLSDDELAFYDALEVNDSAVKVLGDETLRIIARELVDTVRRNAAIDWTVRESVRASLRVMVKRILRKYGYPPDKQEKATQTVLEQAELLCADWVGERDEKKVAQSVDSQGLTSVSSSEQKVVRIPIKPGSEVAPYSNAVPFYELRIAAGNDFAPESEAAQPAGWVNVERKGLRPGMFAARVTGRSMEPLIPDGSVCLFERQIGGVAGSRQGRVVLAQHRSLSDPEHGGRYTVKRYNRVTPVADDQFRDERVEIRLEPENKEFKPISVTSTPDDPVTIVAEFKEVLGS